jgi:hypothetical protein
MRALASRLIPAVGVIVLCASCERPHSAPAAEYASGEVTLTGSA